VTRTRQRKGGVEGSSPLCLRPAPPLAGNCRESGNRYSHAPSSASECRNRGSAPGPGASSGDSGGILRNAVTPRDPDQVHSRRSLGYRLRGLNDRT
jgi:hypothetical protein